MAAPVGNQFWKARTKHGRDRIYASADVLWEACQEYFQWVEDNPLWASKTTQFQGVPIDLPEAKMRAMTLAGLCIFLDIDTNTWREWRKLDDFSRVCTRTEEIIYQQKFSGAAADLLNPSIIARDLGLVEKSKSEITGQDGGPIQISEIKRVIVRTDNPNG